VVAGCFFKKQGACVACAQGKVWQLALAVAALAAGMLAFILLKQGSGVGKRSVRSNLLLIRSCFAAFADLGMHHCALVDAGWRGRQLLGRLCHLLCAASTRRGNRLAIFRCI